MPNQYSSEKKTLGELLSLTSPNIQVPDWQRSYSWDTSQIDTFWRDLVGFSNQYPDDNVGDQEYFLGSIVLVEGGPRLLLLDGQQRLATATILLDVIREFLSKFKDDAATRLSQKFISEIDDATNSVSYKLTLNRYDRDFFKREIQESSGEPPEARLPSHQLIRKGRQFFVARFADQYAALGEGQAGFDWSLRISRVLMGHMSVVAVGSRDKDNAAMVFETLNDRGIGLSTPDLLRNFLLRSAPEEERERRSSPPGSRFLTWRMRPKLTSS